MNFKNLAIGAVAGGVVQFLQGGLLYGWLLKDAFAAGSPAGILKDPPLFGYLILGELCFALLLGFIFLRWAGIRTAGAGAQAGLIIGLLTALGFDMAMYATMNIGNLGIALLDVGVHSLRTAVTGAVIGFVLGKL